MRRQKASISRFVGSGMKTKRWWPLVGALAGISSVLAMGAQLPRHVPQKPKTSVVRPENIEAVVPRAREIAQKSFPSVVLLVMQDARGQPVSLGSGFFVRGGVVATNVHVVEGASQGYARIVGQKSKYEIRGIAAIDSLHDLALLAVPGATAPSLQLGDTRQVQVGDEVYAIGNPQGLEGTFSQGIVSGIREVGPDKFLQITAPISPGSSGGPVLDAQGKVVGVAVATFKGGQNLNFAIPVPYLTALLSQVTVGQSPVPLSPDSTVAHQRSVLADFSGVREGVTGGEFLWDSGEWWNTFFSFTLHNHLRESVEDVYCLVVFYDTNANPIDFLEVRWPEQIPGGLGKRVSGFGIRVDESVKKFTTPSRDQITTYFSALVPATRVEFRVLDFRIAE